MARSLAEWLDYQQNLHVRGIDLGLDRVRAVAERMCLSRPAPLVITVGGTNGKGSTVAFLEAMLLAAGKRVGCYTSPHILRYNERIRIASSDCDDATLAAAFEVIEYAREAISLSYFEFGTLAALWIFAHSALDVAILEVGLGGRLDAVNIVDADVSIVTTVALDHQEYLGTDRASIAREKAGIFRAGRLAVIGEIDPAPALLDSAAIVGASAMRCGVEYTFSACDSGWQWRNDDVKLDLPKPQLAASCQYANAAAAIAALYALRDKLGWHPQAIATGVCRAHVPARLQRFAGAPELIVDVAHNPQAAEVLAEWLGENPGRGRTLAVFSALADKDIVGIVKPLAAQIDWWYVGGLDREIARGATTATVVEGLLEAAPAAEYCRADSISLALKVAWKAAANTDRVIAFGSFHVAAAAIEFARARNLDSAVSVSREV